MKRVLQAVVLSGILAVGSAFAGTEGHGVVKKIDPAKGVVTLKHDAIKSLGWPGMTMDFAVKDKAALSSLKPEQAVSFDLEQEKGGRYVITQIRNEASAHASLPQEAGSQGGHHHGM